MNEFINRLYSQQAFLEDSNGITPTSTSLSTTYSIGNSSSDLCLSEHGNSSSSSMDIDEEGNSRSSSSNISNKVLSLQSKNSTIEANNNNSNNNNNKSQGFLGKKHQIVPFNNRDRELAFKEDMEKKFSSLYVLSFLQNDDLFDFLKSITKKESKEEASEKYESGGTTVSEDNKRKTTLSKVQDCKYLYMIVENPNNMQERFELGLKVIDIVPNYKH